MNLSEKAKSLGINLFFLWFFVILFFDHKHIDILRIPFFAFIIWQLYRKNIGIRFLIDPVSICIYLFAITAFVSNILNGIPQNHILKILNWLFPYYLGKYVVMHQNKIELERILFYFICFSMAFSSVGIVGYLFDIKTLFGVDLFYSSRYIFTFSGTNRVGFYLSIALLLNIYYFLKNGLSIDRKNILYLICLPILAGGLLLTHERKSIFMATVIIFIFLIIYKKYKIFFLTVIVAGILVLLIPIPERYNPQKIFSGHTMYSRYTAWEAAIRLFKQKPVFGHGYPSFKKAYHDYFQKNKNNFKFKAFYPLGVAHNLNFNALAETGLLGCIILNYMFFIARRFYKYRRSSPLSFIFGLTIVFVYITMQTGNFVHAPIRTDLTFLIFGLYFSLEHKHLLEKDDSELASQVRNPNRSLKSIQEKNAISPNI
jgi:O-antigen ligase